MTARGKSDQRRTKNNGKDTGSYLSARASIARGDDDSFVTALIRRDSSVFVIRHCRDRGRSYAWSVRQAR